MPDTVNTRLMRRLSLGLSALPLFFAGPMAGPAAAQEMPASLRELPGIDELVKYRPPVASRVYADDGRLIGEFGVNRIFVPISRIPKRVVHAFMAAEDQRFEQHPGIDLVAMARAALTNLRETGRGRRVVGGSTITQQVAKTFLLSSDRTVDRKVKEVVLALRIEHALAKPKIMELYLGNRSYGVAAAALTYFGKSLGELTIAEAALLAALPKAPSRFNPLRNPLPALIRRDYVIDRMLQDGYISAAEAQYAKHEPLRLHLRKPRVHPHAEYFVEEVRRKLIAQYGKRELERGGFTIRTSLDPRLQFYATRALRQGLVAYDRRHGWRGALANMQKKFGKGWAKRWHALLSGMKPPVGRIDWPMAVVLDVKAREAKIGLEDGRIGTIPVREMKWARRQGRLRYSSGAVSWTAVGPWIGRVSQVLAKGDVILVEEVKKPARGKPYPPNTFTLRQIPKVTGALVSLDPNTGRVLALAGGFSFRLSQYNTVTQARRQPGSAFKPVVYLTALENGFTPSTLVLDAPITLRTDIGEIYTPRNYSGKFYGPTTLRRGLELSRNVTAVRLSLRVGIEKITDMAQRLGLVRDVRPVFSTALGAYEVTPLAMATAYGIIANGGKQVTPTLIDRIQDRTGGTVFRSEKRYCEPCGAARWTRQAMPRLPDRRAQLVSRQSAYQLVQIMRGVVQRGTGILVSSIDKPIAGKTGTTNDWVDAWFVGFTPTMVTAVWVGFDQRLSLGHREQGGVTAAPIFRDYMRNALNGAAVPGWSPPSSLIAMRVSLHNGLPAKYGPVITEYFKPGQEPKPWGAYSPDKGFVRNEDEREPDLDVEIEPKVVRGARRNGHEDEDSKREWRPPQVETFNPYAR